MCCGLRNSKALTYDNTNILHISVNKRRMSTPSQRRRRASSAANLFRSRRNSAVASAAVGALVAAAATYMYWSANSKELTRQLSERKRHVDTQMQDLKTCAVKLQAMLEENLALVQELNASQQVEEGSVRALLSEFGGLEKVRGMLKKHHTELSNLKAELASCSGSLKSVTLKYHNLKSTHHSIENAKQELAVLAQNIIEARSELEHKQQQRHAPAQGNDTQLLKTQVKHLKDDITSLENKIIDLRNEDARLTNTLAILKTSIAERLAVAEKLPWVA